VGDEVTQEDSMKRLLALLVALGVLVMTAPGVDFVRAGDDKKEEKKDDKKKDDKKEAKKEEKKKDEPKLSPEQREELKKLSGTFTLTSYERDGKKATPEELKKMKVVQKGAEWSFSLDDVVTTGRDTPFPDKNPKEIDSIYTNGPDRDRWSRGCTGSTTTRSPTPGRSRARIGPRRSRAT
jgi:uncharacterized protein (TIGR03067 family)